LKALDKKSSPQPEVAQRMEQVIGNALRAQPLLANFLTQSSSTASPPPSLPGATKAATVLGAEGAQQQQAPAGNAAASGGKNGGSSGDEIEETANSYFQKIYTSEQSIAEVLFLKLQLTFPAVGVCAVKCRLLSPPLSLLSP